MGYALVHMEGALQGWESGQYIGEVETLSVLPEARGRGVGTALMDAVERELTQLGVTHLRLRVVAGNDDALRFYRRRGLESCYTSLLGPVSHGRRDKHLPPGA